jgi:TetR/AcrR family transcriptional regulator, transcriptional repressor of bet genes
VPRPSNTQLRRRQIVEALLSVMAERGYDGASTQAIARRAGLAPGLIHYHFASKQEILLEAVRELARVAERRFEDLARPAATPRERLRAFIDARLAVGKGASAAAVAGWVIVGAEAVRQPEVKAAHEEIIRAQLAVLEALLRDHAGGALTRREARHLAAIVLAAIEGAFQLSVSARDVMPTGYAAKALMDLVESRLGTLPART